MVHRNKFMKSGEVPLLQRVRDQLDRHVHAVHRLDGGTSGCLLFAFDAKTVALLQAAMSSDATAHKPSGHASHQITQKRVFSALI